MTLSVVFGLFSRPSSLSRVGIVANSIICFNEVLINSVIRVLSSDERVIFAYLYGSLVSEEKGYDIDIALYPTNQADAFSLSLDLRIDLHKVTGLAPDVFDVRILSEIIDKGDIFGLLYLKNVLDRGRILVDNNPEVRMDFLENYGWRYRECEGFIQEVMA
jgi:predicted nucleotidyltransferase